ncbi:MULTISPECIES: DUF3983 domain-containing protein [Bacillaceae]|uniref:DUF3983 domain-containing protein n=1 Tax=Bacillaceae TaxID=186817 RepID=UPI001145392C|nr:MULTISPECIES: DUF3983 domain-containing protein [Bacillaceae]UGB31692.1 DUF3983 domain-containing protein [Metabacillus sp. B2-18]
MVANKRKHKKRLGKLINKRIKEADKQRVESNWRNIFVKKGILKEEILNDK